MEGQSQNVLAALAVLNGTAAGLHDHLAYLRRISDEYLGVRTGGVQALAASTALAGAVGLLGVAAGLAESKSFAPCKCVRSRLRPCARSRLHLPYLVELWLAR